MEKDDELKGIGNSYNTEFRQYDPRVGRWLSVDPISMSYESPYASFRNNPIIFNDPKGDCPDCYGFTTPSGEFMYASNKHFLWNKEGLILEKADEIAYSITTDGVDFHWNQKLEGYYSNEGGKYSNPDSSWYDAFILAGAEIGKASIDPQTYKDMLFTTFELLASNSNSNPELAVSMLDSGISQFEKVKRMDGTEATKTIAKVVYGVVLSRTLSKKAPTSTQATSKAISSSVDDLFYNIEVDVYHKGNLSNGKVSVGKSLSTGTDLQSVASLNRDGIIHKFSIPKSVFDEWKSKNLIQELKDYDFETGVYNNELRFDPSISSELNKYKTYGTGE